MGFPSGVASLEREALDPYQSFITGGAAVATLEGGFSMPGNRELTPSASCPNWPNIRDLLTSADDLCSGNARGEPGFELEEPSAIDMRSIGISNKKLFPLGSTYIPPRLAVRGLVRRWATSKRRRGVLPPSRATHETNSKLALDIYDAQSRTNTNRCSDERLRRAHAPNPAGIEPRIPHASHTLALCRRVYSAFPR